MKKWKPGMNVWKADRPKKVYVKRNKKEETTKPNNMKSDIQQLQQKLDGLYKKDTEYEQAIAARKSMDDTYFTLLTDKRHNQVTIEATRQQIIRLKFGPVNGLDSVSLPLNIQNSLSR